jgi:hypothetical protein
MVKRLHRHGQTKPTIVHRLVCRGTVDEAVLAAQAGRARTHAEIMAALKSQVTATA